MCHEMLKAMTSLLEPLTCLNTLVSILELFTVFHLVKLTLYVVLVPSPVFSSIGSIDQTTPNDPVIHFVGVAVGMYCNIK